MSQAGLIDGKVRDDLTTMEEKVKSLIAENKTVEAHEVYGDRSFDVISNLINSPPRLGAWNLELGGTRQAAAIFTI